ncbi:hypothetical protein A3F08_03080 [Candidatus Berkelbacteria bacterium RIFCSPHIGHO2_12_FULL_36_9]|uniref:DUF4145 domain-containing protein n=1 Tax=Candidatus Berkelbacteria bacterium RIFCSPHIGHO2_12_FULL_36_9 TaxID=1797469 RepID=A0A1F5EH04_9BACT|nr:MAG: hypothetical protein A3F08_03080 [Candidatus Berkelbacteria bacterium RIFCSPHIGHO2_12_FULL_36_9]
MGTIEELSERKLDDRGEILDIFCRLEYIINEIIILNLNVNSREKFLIILDCVDLFSKIKILNNWKILNNRNKEILLCLEEVRNGFAHSWSDREVKYKGIKFAVNLEKFKKDFLYVWHQIIEIYRKHQPNPIELLKSYKKINNTCKSKKGTVGT